MENLKDEFATWLLNNAPESYSNFLGNSIDSIIEKLNEIDAFFQEKSLFEVNENNIQENITYVKSKIGRDGRKNNPAFENYDSKRGSGIPKAILGKKNYLKFLNNKYSNFKEYSNSNSLNFKIILVNITWNSKDWKEVSEDASGHAWVGGENIPHESWNFDFDNPRNENDTVLGFAKFTNPPKVEGNNNLIIFYSKGKIVGFYGNAEILQETKNINEQESYNLIGDRNLSLVLETKIDNLKEKGYLEELERVGQIGFSYLKKDETALEILEEAILLNPEQVEILKNIMDWIENQGDDTSDEERLIARIKEIGISDSQKFYIIMENIVKGLSIMEGDKRFCYSLPKNKLIGLTIGRKYCAIIDRKQRKNTYRYFDTTNNEKNWLKQANSMEDMAKEMNIIIQSANLELSKTVRTGYYNHSSNSLEKSIFDPEYKSLIFKRAFNTEIKPENMNTNLNQILFGPPGTGKTFNTINEALKIVDPLYYAAHQKDRKKLTDRFKELLIKSTDENKGQIAFCTFHQSFSYEDFVEGIKPKTTDTKSVYYDTEPGVFKRICQLADSYNSTVKVKKEGKLSWDEEQFKKASFYKLSLGNYQNPLDKPIYEFCRDNGYITIGFGQENDFTGLSESEIKEKCEDLKLEVTAAQQMNFFIHYLKKNNYVIVSNGNKYVRALGKVTGDYEYWEDSPIPYNHFRKVEWIFTDELIPIEEIYERGLSQKTMYKIDESALKQDFFTTQGQQVLLDVIDEKKYVLIIDEINRGNVSSIFGELITLIEKDKRAGCDEELEVTLPYSKNPFKVPNNVYLIGTMNTADRSIEALDTALRRRFSFKEFPPKTYLIKTEGASGMVNGMVEDIDLEALLITINNRIEKLIDKDHRIGHSYFLKVDNKEKLIHAFKNEIIPLLEEYFFGDYGKIGLVLGNSFVEKINHDFSFADFKAYDNDIQSDLKEKAVFRITDDSLWNFSAI